MRKRQRDAAQQQEQLKEAAMAGLPEQYFEDEFEAPLFEMQRLPPNFQVSSYTLVKAQARDTALQKNEAWASSLSLPSLFSTPKHQEPHARQLAAPDSLPCC